LEIKVSDVVVEIKDTEKQCCSITIRYDTIRYDIWFALENWQASCSLI